jgi:hypothetical protein
MIMRQLLTYIFIAIVFISCEEPFKLDIEQTPPKLVIEGLVTDVPNRQSVKLSMSGGFYTSGKTERVTNATVTVTDDLGNLVSFVHNPRAHADSAGIYIPAEPFTGEIGRTYFLKVEANGGTYEAHDQLVKVLPVDSLTYNVNEDEKKDPDNDGKIYEVLLFAREDQSVDNFYLFKFYRNDTLTFANESDIYYSDDEALAEKLDGVPAPVFYRLGEKATVEIYSISRIGFVYYNDLSTLLNNDSGMFSPIPASPRTNVSNGALGFFQVSSLGISEIKIE